MADGNVMFVDAADLLERSRYLVEDDPEHWSEQFRHERYDWNDPAFIAENALRPDGYRVVPLTKGYFTIVSPALYAFITEHPDGSPKRWRANVQLEPRTGEICRVYAVRNGRSCYGEPAAVYLHREIANAWGPGVFVDHKNALSLDNRGTGEMPVNLRCVGYAENAVNCRRPRTVNIGLPVGVERLPYGKYIGVHFRTVEGKRKKLRSEPCETAEEAAAWYQAQLTEIFRHREWALNPTQVNYPTFPPLIDSDMSERSWQLRQTLRRPELEDIPF